MTDPTFVRTGPTFVRTGPTFVRTDDGCDIAAYDFGGDGAPVLFLHATGFHAHGWLPVIDHLRDRFHCYALDVRGHGASPTPANENFDWRRMAADARNVAAAFGLQRPRGVGHSAGGAQLVMAEEDVPGTWDSLWVFEPVIPDGVLLEAVPSENPLAAGALRRRERFDSRAAAIANFAAKPPFSTFDPLALELYVEFGFVEDDGPGVTLACRREDESATYANALSPGTYERLDSVNIPVRVACGETSTHFPPARLNGVVDRLPHGSLEVMHGLGHFGPFEAPSKVAASIRAALS